MMSLVSLLTLHTFQYKHFSEIDHQAQAVISGGRGGVMWVYLNFLKMYQKCSFKGGKTSGIVTEIYNGKSQWYGYRLEQPPLTDPLCAP